VNCVLLFGMDVLVLWVAYSCLSFLRVFVDNCMRLRTQLLPICYAFPEFRNQDPFVAKWIFFVEIYLFNIIFPRHL